MISFASFKEVVAGAVVGSEVAVLVAESVAAVCATVYAVKDVVLAEIAGVRRAVGCEL